MRAVCWEGKEQIQVETAPSFVITHRIGHPIAAASTVSEPNGSDNIPVFFIQEAMINNLRFELSHVPGLLIHSDSKAPADSFVAAIAGHRHSDRHQSSSRLRGCAQ